MKHNFKLCCSVLFFVCVSVSFQASAVGKGSKGQEEQHSYIGTLGRVLSCAWTSLYDMNYQILFPEGEEDSLSKHVFDFADGSETEKQRQTQREERGEVRKNQDTPVASQPKLLTQAIVKLAQLAQAYFVVSPMFGIDSAQCIETRFKITAYNPSILCSLSTVCPLSGIEKVADPQFGAAAGSYIATFSYGNLSSSIGFCVKSSGGGCVHLPEIAPGYVQTGGFETYSVFQDYWSRLRVYSNTSGDGFLQATINKGAETSKIDYRAIFTSETEALRRPAFKNSTLLWDIRGQGKYDTSYLPSSKMQLKDTLLPMVENNGTASNTTWVEVLYAGGGCVFNGTNQVTDRFRLSELEKEEIRFQAVWDDLALQVRLHDAETGLRSDLLTVDFKNMCFTPECHRDSRLSANFCSEEVWRYFFIVTGAPVGAENCYVDSTQVKRVDSGGIWVNKQGCKSYGLPKLRWLQKPLQSTLLGD